MQVSASSTLGGAAPLPFAADPDAAGQQDAQEQDSAAGNGNGSSSLKDLLPDSALSPNIALQLQAKPQAQTPQQTAQARQATIGPPQGYLADLQGITKSDQSVGDKLKMAWDATKYHWRNPDTALGGSIDDQGCIITPDNGPKICVGPAAIEGIGAKIEAGALSAAQKALSSTASKGTTAVDVNAAKAAGEATAGAAVKGGASFASDAKLLEHFGQHGAEFGTKNANEYLQVGKDIMQNGQRVEYLYKGAARTGYVQFMGNISNGTAKFGFVGTNADGAITTIHVKSGKDFWRAINGSPTDKVIKAE